MAILKKSPLRVYAYLYIHIYDFFFLLYVLVYECVWFFCFCLHSEDLCRIVVKQPLTLQYYRSTLLVYIYLYAGQMKRIIRTGSQDLKLLLLVVIVFAIPEVHVFCNIYKHRIFKAVVMRVHHRGGCNRKCERLDGLRTFLPF